MAVFCITQARLGSSRLPQKVLKTIDGKSLIQSHVERVQQSKRVNKHILAIPNSVDDQALADYCQTQSYAYYRGSENNVLERFYQAALEHGANDNDTIVRLTGDCPLICPQLIDKVVDSHISDNGKGYTHLNLANWARGLDVEVFSMANLRKAYELAKTADEQEHVTLCMYSNPTAFGADFTIMPVNGGNEAWQQYRICIDEQDDFLAVSALVNQLIQDGLDWQQASGQQICECLDKHPEIVSINRTIQQKKPNQ